MRLHGRRRDRAARLLLDTLLPPVCPGCADELPRGRWRCARCRARFRSAPAAWLCLVCRVRDRAAGDREAGFHCRDPAHDALRGRAAFWMEPPLDAFIHALKFGERPDLARPLGRLVARRVAVRPGVVTGLPLHAARRRERGYDQADLLARAAARVWGAPVASPVLVRRRATAPQARLRMDRREANVARAFVPAWSLQGGTETWVLFDDVVTTGATLLAACRVLAEAGAARVVPVALAVA